jgi:hypothetical protein
VTNKAEGKKSLAAQQADALTALAKKHSLLPKGAGCDAAARPSRLMSETKRLLVKQALESGLIREAEVQTSPVQGDPSSGIFNPAKIVEGLNLWRQSDKPRYFRPIRGGQEWVVISEQDVRRALRLRGVFSSREPGQACSQADRVVEYISDNQIVDFSGRFAGYKAGVHQVRGTGRHFVALTSYNLIEPVKGNWSMLRRVLEGMLRTTEADQTEYFYAWLKVAIEALRSESQRGGHALIMVGEANSGKSFLQQHVITPLLGGRQGDPEAYFNGKTDFNADLFAAEHLAIQELKSGTDLQSRSFLAEQLKKIVSTEGHPFKPKGVDAILMYPLWRVTISINREQLRMLPALTQDLVDKILLFKIELRPMPMPTRTDAERAAFRDAIASELPAFVDFLLTWSIPPALRQRANADRFGFDSCIHPELADESFEQEPEALLLRMIDEELFDDLEPNRSWGWKSAHELAETLTRSQRFEEIAKKLLRYNNTCGILLRRLKDKFPKRFEWRHSKRGNEWLIHRSSE